MKERIEKFLELKSKEINRIAEKYPEEKSLRIDYNEFARYDHEFAEELITNFDEVINIFDSLLTGKIRGSLPDAVEEPRFHARFYNLPKEKGYTVMVRDITAAYISRFISVEGLVNKISDVLPKVLIGRFYCNKCNEPHDEHQATRFLREPLQCKNCRKREFRFSPEDSRWTDMQKIEIQEPLEMLKGGEQARRIEIWLEDDLVDLVTAGDKVIVTGVVRLLPPKFKGPVYFKFIEANSIEGIEKEFEDIVITPEEENEIKKLSKDPNIRRKVINSIAPSIYGYNEVKEAVALQLFGGRPHKKLPDGTVVRPDIHLLLVGDPGVAKSRILQYVNQIAPKSIYVTGKGTTGAGLTATAERDEFAEGAWTLKAGALVLAGGGIVAIDEFDKMDKEDRSAMHEAMEQQTISVAKAGIVTKFKANTSVLAASNPKFSRFDNYKPLVEQFDIPATLISRFDLIFPIRDVLDRERDMQIAEHMLKMHKTGEDMKGLEPEIPVELFRKYIAYSRKNTHPVLTNEAAEKIKDFYVTLRGMSKEAITATPRQLEALVRLSEASSKMRLSDTVTVTDVERAIELTNFVLMAVAYDQSTGMIDTDRISAEHSSSARARIRVIEEIIKGLIDSSDEGLASSDDIISSAQSKNIDKFDVEKSLNELTKHGVIYEPRHGWYNFAVR